MLDKEVDESYYLSEGKLKERMEQYRKEQKDATN